MLIAHLGQLRERFTAWWKSPKTRRGQSLVEVAVFFPILLILLSGLVEFGFFMNEYLAMQDAVRNAARFSSDSDYLTGDFAAVNTVCNTNFPQRTCCNQTRHFYRQAACLVNQELTLAAPDVEMLCLEPGPNNTCNYGVINPANGGTGDLDDIVISVFSVENAAGTVRRFGGSNGWSYAENYAGYTTRNQTSEFSTTDITTRLESGAPSTGYILIELFYNYDQKLKLPWITAFVPDPIRLHAFAIMPLVSAEPTPTPIP